jgi:4-hydroxy-4-methyl-2-oxoglutarate aldolase
VPRYLSQPTEGLEVDVLDGQELVPGTVFDSSPSVEVEVLSLFAEVGVANVASALGGPLARQRLLDAHALPRVAGTGAVAGTAVTVWNPAGSNGMLIYALRMLRAGDFLVVDGCHETAQWGDVAATMAVARGAVAAAVDGAVRDLERIREMPFSLWGARVYALQGFRKDRGFVNAPVAVGGMIVRPGDVVLGDSDGLLSIPRGLVTQAFERAKARQAVEKEEIERANSVETMTPNDKKFEISAELEELLTGEVTYAGKTWEESFGGIPALGDL